MGKPFVFVSCGQFTLAERRLGGQICELVRKTTDLDAFFAQDVQDLNGLDSNILEALRNCAGFITVMHPRGEIERPGSSKRIRASVWIEQEIAVATYIQRVEKRPLPVIAFVHRSIGREGIRELLHLNPIPFTEESEVLAALPGLLKRWGRLTAGVLRVQLQAKVVTPQGGHPIRKLYAFLSNDTNQSITNFAGKLCLPRGILAHWTAVYPEEVRSDVAGRRCFRFDGKGRGYIPPHDTRTLISFDYCTTCAAQHAGSDAQLVAHAVVEVKVWIDGREYSDQKTIEELAREREGAGG